MERVLTPKKKRTAAAESGAVFITPAAQGWRVRHGAAPMRTIGALGEVTFAPGEAIHLALPASAVLLERMQLPSTDREELAGMMRLQLEKTLPFSADEVSSDFEIIGQTETGTELLALAAGHAQLDALCEPLRAHRQLPEKITLFAMHVAAACAEGETVCIIYREQDAVVLAIAQNSRLAFAQAGDAAADDAEAFFSSLPQTLLGAELEGVPVGFARAQLDSTLGGWHTAAREFFAGVPVDLISLDQPLPEPAVNLAPAKWSAERRQLQRAARIRSRLILAGALYLAALLAVAVYVILLGRQVAALDRQIAAAQPQVDFIATRKARWNALAPAIDPTRFTVELLYQVTKTLPSPDIRITVFDQTPKQFMVEGEAPTANAAVEFGEGLRNNPELKQFKFETAPPVILGNEHAQFRIFGKL